MISCLCPTYGRCPDYQWLLEEAIESFVRQTNLYMGMEHAELIILNDCPSQELVLDQVVIDGRLRPDFQIRIVNLPYRLPSLGDKFNMLVAMARGDLLVPWEDDDISLPERLVQAFYMMRDGIDYWKPPQVWFLQHGMAPVWKHNVGVRHHASIFTRDAWRRFGGYPRASGNQDAIMDSKLMDCRHQIEHFPAGIPPAEWQYIYRWGVSPNHLSGNSDCEAAWRAEALKPRQAGRFILRPHWRQDYSALTRQAL
jgi:glycosyltransferase involved in cell wall biosynthesis